MEVYFQYSSQFLRCKNQIHQFQTINQSFIILLSVSRTQYNKNDCCDGYRWDSNKEDCVGMSDML